MYSATLFSVIFKNCGKINIRFAILSLFNIYFCLFIDLAAPDLHCGLQDPRLRPVGSGSWPGNEAVPPAWGLSQQTTREAPECTIHWP